MRGSRPTRSQATPLQINPPERHGHAMAVFGIGTILGGFFHFDPVTTWLQLTVWVVYLVVTLAAYLRPQRPSARRRSAPVLRLSCAQLRRSGTASSRC